MIDILLVDDEFLVCSFLKQMVAWEEHGYRIVGQASNGHAAMEKIQELRPAVVILDVNMPEMDGISLIRWLSSGYPEIQVIMLSSYSDYRYVRETMKLGAVDYLLKHELNGEALLMLLDGMKLPGNREPLVSKAAWEADPLLPQRQLQEFLCGEHVEAPANLKELCKPIMVVAAFQLSVAGISREQDGHENFFIRQILATCMEIGAQSHETQVVYPGGEALLLVYGADPGETEAAQMLRVDRNMGIIRDALVKYHNIYLNWRRGKRLSAAGDMPGEYHRIQAQKVPRQTDVVVMGGCLSIEQERRLITAVLGKNRILAQRLMEEVFCTLQGPSSHKEALRILSGDLLSLIVKLYQENSVSFGETDRQEVVRADAAALQAYYTRLLLTLIDAMDNRACYSGAVTTILDFVNRSFRQDLSLADISSHVGLNPSYISSLFKRETGVALTHYINRVRIYEAGKQMLMEDVSPTRIYEAVGFRNYNNFFNLFKEITGYAPGKFREAVTSDWIASFHPLTCKMGQS